MKITNISIKNYRSCVEANFYPHKDISILIGPNGSGKTNILSAIRLVSSLCYVRNRRIRDDKSLMYSPCEIRVEYEIDGKKIIHTAAMNIVTNENNQDEIINSKETWYMRSITGSKKRIQIPSSILFEMFLDNGMTSNWNRASYYGHLNEYLKLKGVSGDGLQYLKRVIEFVTQMKYYSASQFTNPGSCPISFEVEGEAKRRTGISITGHKKFLFDVYQEYLLKSEVFSEFIDLVGPDGIGLIESISFDEIKTSSSSYSVMTGGRVVKKERSNLLVVPSFKISNNSLSPSQLSEGTFKALALIFYLVTDNSSLLMIEEPEVCVHHGLLNSIVELIKVYSKNKQIIVSTHSDSVLDRVYIDNVYRVFRHDDSGTQISNISKKLGKSELSVIKKYLENEGSLGEYWKHGDLENV